MKKYFMILSVATAFAACNSDADKTPKDDGINQDSLTIMDNNNDRNNRNTTRYDSIPRDVIKDSTNPDSSHHH